MVRILAVLGLVASVVAGKKLAQSVLLDDEPEDGARCLDGTPARFWIQPAEPASINSTKWSFHLMGGGNCESLDDCADRAFSLADGNCYLGSSSVECFNANPDASIPLHQAMAFTDIPSCKGARWCGGLMTEDAKHNPLTHDWNKVFVQYCDGGMWMGNNATTTWVDYQGQQRALFFRGFRNADGVLTRLLREYDLQSATDLILSGDSSGGIGTLWLADHFSSRLSTFGIRVAAVPDHGYFFEDKYWLAHDYDWRGILKWTYRQMNGTTNQECRLAALATGSDPAELCTLPETSTGYIKTPLFLVNSRYDPTWEAASGVAHSETERMGAKLMALFNTTVLNRPANAAFVTACSQHCGQWAQDQQLGKDNSDFQVYVDGDSAATAVNAWFGGFTERRLWVQPGEFPCQSCCHMRPPASPLQV